MSDPNQRNLELDRLIFFSDAIVAIAITLLALGLRLESIHAGDLKFSDLIAPWRKYLDFILSFINIAGFWQTHHAIFSYVKKIDRKMLLLNLCWLFFIVVLPFSTSVISDHFSETPAVCLYSGNVFLLSLLQKFIWDHGDDEIGDTASPDLIQRIDIMFTVNMANGVIALILSFFYPLMAFILLFLKVPIFAFEYFYSFIRKKPGTSNGLK